MKTNNKINWDIVFKSAPIVCMLGLTAIILMAARLFPPYIRMYGVWISDHPNLHMLFYVLFLDFGHSIAEYNWRKSNVIKKGLPVTWSILFDTGFDLTARILGQSIAILIAAWLVPFYMNAQHLNIAEYSILYIWLYMLFGCIGYWGTHYARMKKDQKYKSVIS